MTAPGSPSGSDPYLSIVLTGRNDNFGGDFNETIQPACGRARIRAHLRKPTCGCAAIPTFPVTESQILACQRRLGVAKS